MDRFETQYPINAREAEIKQILHYVTRGQSCQLISVPGAGRSTVLRLLAYHEKLLHHHLASKGETFRGKLLFIYLNFAELSNFDSAELTKAIFLAILAAIREEGPNQEPFTTLGKEIYALFKEALALNDPIVLLEYLKKSIQLCNHAAISPIFLFDRFSEFAEKTSGDFFSNLRTLRTASGGKLSVVFSTHRPLEDLLPSDHWGDFYEFFVGNHIYLEMHDPVATNFRIEVLEKEYGKKLQPKLKEELVRITGGHGKLMKLGTQLLFPDRTHPRGGVAPAAGPRGESLIDFLLSSILIKGSLLEIWQALTLDERKTLREYIFNNIAIKQFNNSVLPKLGLPFPLLTEFVRRNIVEQLVPKTIRLDEKANEIFFGDETISDLTAQEFKLLSFLIKNPTRVCERDEIITAVWSDTKTAEGVSDEALDQMVHRVRKKIEDEADNPKHLLTVKGRGFRFIP